MPRAPSDAAFAQQGQDVFVLIDDRDGRRRASREARWLRDQGHKTRLDLWSTRRVLQEAGRHEGWIKGNLTWGAGVRPDDRRHVPVRRGSQVRVVPA